MSEWSFIAAAYGVTWVTLVGYALYLARRARAVRGAVGRPSGRPSGEGRGH